MKSGRQEQTGSKTEIDRQDNGKRRDYVDRQTDRKRRAERQKRQAVRWKRRDYVDRQTNRNRRAERQKQTGSKIGKDGIMQTGKHTGLDGQNGSRGFKE